MHLAIQFLSRRRAFFAALYQLRQKADVSSPAYSKVRHTEAVAHIKESNICTALPNTGSTKRCWCSEYVFSFTPSQLFGCQLR